MKIVYDQASDVLRITFSESAIEESDEDKPGIIVGLEVLDASSRIENPRALDFAVTG